MDPLHLADLLFGPDKKPAGYWTRFHDHASPSFVYQSWEEEEAEDDDREDCLPG